VYCNVLQCVAVRDQLLDVLARCCCVVRCYVVQSVAVCCSVLQRVAVCSIARPVARRSLQGVAAISQKFLPSSNLLTMVWLRLVGSLKLLVSFAEYSLFYRALLQKRPIIFRSLLIIATP